MGTSVRLFLENAFSATQILAPWLQFYHLHDLADPDVLREPRQFVRGHFRWALIDRTQDRDWRIITVLREPMERLLSKFDYMKQLQRLPPTLTVEEWLRTSIQPSDCIAGYFIFGSETDLAAGASEVARSLRIHVEEAMAHLHQCRAVGLQERPDECLNLLAWTTGALPPGECRRVNRSERRHFLDGLSPEAGELLREVTALDRLLYEEGRKMFEDQHTTMLEHVRHETGRSLNPQEVRAHLRSHALARLELAHEFRAAGGGDAVLAWNPDDVFPGENLHSREHYEGASLRWTGPSEETCFHFAVEPGRRLDVTIKLHAATPVECARAAKLSINGQGILLRLRCDEAGSACTLHGRITPEMLQTGAVMRRFVLQSPVKRGMNEWRMLGLCLRGIEFRRCQPDG